MMTDQHVDITPKGSHVSFSQNIDYDVTPSARQLDRLHTSTPSTPPKNSNNLPTPPSSHIEMASSTHPSPPQTDPQTQPHASTSQIAPEGKKGEDMEADQSPSLVVHQRRAKRVSAGSSTTLKDATSSSPPRPTSERHLVLAEAHRGRSRGRKGKSGNDSASDGSGSSRSRTPSPILGSMTDSNGHLSFAASLVPSAEEVHALLYGKDDGKAPFKEERRPSEVKKDDMESLMSRLASMGFANVEQKGGATGLSREEELAGMVKKLIAHARQQEKYMDSTEETLHDTRIRSISLLTSLRTTFAHSLAAEYSLRARVQAELDGARIQAKKLSVMLARSESRNEEIDRERAMSAEEEVLWQEEMKDHASAYAQQQAARARAAQMAQAQTHGQRSVHVDAIKNESVTAIGHEAEQGNETITGSSPLPPTTPPPATSTLEEAFEERKTDDAGITGLGISSGNAVETVLQTTSSPLSTIVKERNKLLSDKRYLKSRIRDTEAQRDRLEIELKNLRPLLVRGAPSKSTSASHATATTPAIGYGPSTPGKGSHKRDRSRRRRQATMGDAEAEHLLLAARRLRELNRQKYVDEDGRPKTPPPGATPSSSTQPRTPKTPRTMMATPRSVAGRDVMDSVASSRMTDRSVAPNGSPLALKNSGSTSLGRWGRHERVDSAMSGSGIEDLLQAAQTVLTPEKKTGHRQSHSRSKSGHGVPGSDEDGELDGRGVDEEEGGLLPTNVGSTFSSKDFGPLNESPKRRRVSSATLDMDRSHNGLTMSPDKRAAIFQGGRRIRTSTEGAEPLLNALEQHNATTPLLSQGSSALSALDLLADQAAASQQPSQSSDRSHSGEGETNMDPDEVYGSDDEEGMAIDEEEEPSRPITEGGIGSHYYPRGAYGHAYAQQPVSGPDAYRMTNQSGYTYGPPGQTTVPLSNQGWTSQNVGAPRNGVYAPRGVSPPVNGSRFAAAYQNGPRISTGHIHHTPKSINGSNSITDNNHHHHQQDQGGNHNNNRTPQKGGNTSPDKRLPYVRWSDEEDQKLRKAISEYGQRWESVARVVGTRSYHQCRQRYLLMRRKEAAARDGTSNEDNHSSNHITA